MTDTSTFSLGVTGYFPPAHVGHVESFFKNFEKFKTRHPVKFYSYGRTTPPGIIPLKCDPEYLKKDPAIFEKNRVALNNATFYTGVKIAHEAGWTHMMYLEHDCRIGCDWWDDIIWQEFLTKCPDAIMAGTPVVFNPSSWSRETAIRYEQFLRDTHPRWYPIPTAGSGRLAEKQHTAVFPNGAFAIYRMDWMWKTFGPAIEAKELIKMSIETRAWDYEIGLRLWNEFEGEAYKKVGCLTKVFSGYGELMSTEEERRQWLNSGKVVGIHQVKSDWVGPDRDAGEPIVIEEMPAIVSSNGQYPEVEILIVSFRRDADFLRYNLRSIQKFAVGFKGVTVVVPTQDEAIFRPMCQEFGATLKTVEEPLGKGHATQELVKFSADLYCDADYILHTDSDCLFRRRVTPLDYFQDGKPVLLCRPYNVVARVEPGHEQWQSRAETALGFEVPFDTMVRAPLIYPRELYPAVRAAVEKNVGKPIDQWIYSLRCSFPPEFAEFPTMGGYGMKFMSDRFTVIDIGDKREPDNPLIQGWSPKGVDHPIHYKDGFTGSHRERAEALLAQ